MTRAMLGDQTLQIGLGIRGQILGSKNHQRPIGRRLHMRLDETCIGVNDTLQVAGLTLGAPQIRRTGHQPEQTQKSRRKQTCSWRPSAGNAENWKKWKEAPFGVEQKPRERGLTDSSSATEAGESKLGIQSGERSSA